MALSTFGSAVLAQARPGDGQLLAGRPLAAALAMSYQIGSIQRQVALAVSYTIERKNVAPLLVYYQIVPPSVFLLAGQPLPVQPDHVSYAPAPVVGRTLLGGPLLQGYKQMAWSYSVLPWKLYSQMLALYNPQQPLIAACYPDENGTWVQRTIVMHPPSYGTQQTVLVYDVTFTFLIPAFS